MSKGFIASMVLTGLVAYIAIPDAHAISASQIKRHVEQNNRQKTSIYNKSMQTTFERQDKNVKAYISGSDTSAEQRNRYSGSSDANVEQWQKAGQENNRYQQPTYTPSTRGTYGSGSAGSTSSGSGGSGSKQKSGGNMWGF
ncbi:MAG: hypothetical protein CMF48_06165 [Legionellales bacterium]|nr:hypothetical protein [Legionellales bacterium]|tara:strand:- start:2795 stop:3217 length:423 start_codon:yes stop_codon:yes gene_type:complete